MCSYRLQFPLFEYPYLLEWLVHALAQNDAANGSEILPIIVSWFIIPRNITRSEDSPAVSNASCPMRRAQGHLILLSWEEDSRQQRSRAGRCLLTFQARVGL